MIAVRMGEIVVCADPREELVAIGLGSCIALAVVDPAARIAGLAHVVLPDSAEYPGLVPRRPGAFADVAVPELLRRLHRAGAVARRLEAVLVGGARMFVATDGPDIGTRNERAVRAALGAARVLVHAAATGGSEGRAAAVAVGSGEVTVRVAGERAMTLLAGWETEPWSPVVGAELIDCGARL